ncbi:urease subunit beta [Paenibacillus sp. FA6]|uniref:urease subunit beta n=1 Tax=Paenibacillus sp. FA6 TaxID=3413029 RepID=UPI003F65DF6E
MQPGELILRDEEILCNVGRKTKRISILNTGDRPIQVGSHFHLFEANEALKFDRDAAFGQRLSIPAGAAVRFEPGDEKEVELICFAGERQVYGFNNLTDGSVERGCEA